MTGYLFQVIADCIYQIELIQKLRYGLLSISIRLAVSYIVLPISCYVYFYHPL